jgi:hypothetical protein
MDLKEALYPSASQIGRLAHSSPFEEEGPVEHIGTGLSAIASAVDKLASREGSIHALGLEAIDEHK